MRHTGFPVSKSLDDVDDAHLLFQGQLPFIHQTFPLR